MSIYIHTYVYIYIYIKDVGNSVRNPLKSLNYVLNKHREY